MGLVKHDALFIKLILTQQE